MSDDDRRSSALTIDREAEHLNRLVTNLLDLSRIEAGALRADLEPTDLDDIVRPILDRLGDRLEGRSVEIDLPGPDQAVLVDPVFLDQIVTNLLENAAKYVPVGALVRISAARRAESVLVTVEDSGPGVPPAALTRLFEKFYRVTGTGTRSRPGTGIGLAVVRGLTEAMGGRVHARQSDLGGLAVDVDLPIAPTLVAVAEAPIAG
jgi:two-component system sensor histidine kinase KdpD